jgi:dipeptidyl aminopeptidase/acylaminoacyl peptidase
MGFKEWSIDCRNKKFPAKPQSSKEEQAKAALARPRSATATILRIRAAVPPCLFFAALRLCGKLLLLALSLAIPASAQAPRQLAPADILRVANVSDAQISPNGDWIVYTVATTEADETRTRLWLARAQNSRFIQAPRMEDVPRALLPLDWTGSNPRWSPDGNRIAFISTQGAQKGIWVVSPSERRLKIDSSVRPATTAVELIPHFVAPVSETNFFITYAGEPLAWSPDSKSIAYISTAEQNAETSADAGKGDDPRVVDRLQYKSRTSLSDRLRAHVWIAEVDKPEPRQLTSGPFYDHALTFSPTGDEIGFLSNHELDPDAINNSDIFAVDLHGQVRQITQTKGCEYEPTWSPDGKWIAYVATRRDVTTIDSVAEDTHVWVIAAAGGVGRELTSSQDRRARSPRWTDSGKALLFVAGDRGRSLIYKVVASDGKLSSIFDAPDARLGQCPGPDMLVWPTGKFQVGGFSVSAAPSERWKEATVAFTVSGANNPGEVYIHGSGPKCWPNRLDQISYNNNQFLGILLALNARPNEPATASPSRGRLPIEPDEVNFKSFDGTPIQGWLMKPVGWRADRKYPMILSIHGGPHGMYGYAFNPSFQVYAARGYAVLYLNPRGSSGYGQKFSDGTLNEWGGGDYKDLMAGVDEALRRYSWIDPDRLGVTGGSYGGFMTNWVITQTPRFKAAVSAASVSNLISFYSTSLYQDLIHAEFGGFPWDNYDLLWQWSPLRYVRQAQTPTLFIHGEQDNDVHITQAEEMYMALKRRGVETALVRYPREGHGFHEPRHRVDALQRTLAWFDQFLK